MRLQCCQRRPVAPFSYCGLIGQALRSEVEVRVISTAIWLPPGKAELNSSVR
jgi:hypothetical protein